jgi:hypothetical protein
MEELFNTLWAWVVENLTPFLTAGNLALIAGVLFKQIRQKTTLSGVSANSNALSAALKDNTKANESAAKLKQTVEAQDEKIEYLTQKTDAVLDMLYAVYSGSQTLSDKTKAAVTGLYTDNRFATTKARKAAMKLFEDAEAEAVAAAENVKKKTENARKILT